MTGQGDALLELRQIAVRYEQRGRQRAPMAVDGVSVSVGEGEIVGLVGESGSGKTTLGRVAAGMLLPTKGELFFAGEQIDARSRADMAQHRLRVQMIFQDPAGSLNPRMTIGDSLDEVLFVHRKHLGLPDVRTRLKRRNALLDQTGLAQTLANRYPHALSGGQKQRAGIARALAVQPRLLIADEPVSALDVSIQVQILNVLKQLNMEQGLSCLLVAHDLAVVRYMCKRVYVMRQGQIVESGSCDKVYQDPQHPYTRNLLEAVPDVAKGLQARQQR